MNAENSQELLEEKNGTATDAHAAKVSGLFAVSSNGMTVEQALKPGFGPRLAKMPCRCRTSRAGGRKAGSRSCCGYVGCYISGAQAPPRRTGAGNGLLPSHAGAWAKEAFGRRQRLRSFRRGRRTSPASPRRVYGRPHHGFRHPQHCPPLSLLRGDGASPQAQRPGLYPGIWDRERRVPGSASTISI